MRQADRLSKDRLPKGRGTGQTQAERGLRVTKSGKQEHKKSQHRLIEGGGEGLQTSRGDDEEE